MADEKPKHKPSPKRTLEEVLKSLQDLIRNDLVSRRDAHPAPPEPPPTPPAASIPDSFDEAIDKLDELIKHELVEPAKQARVPRPGPEEPLPQEAEWPPEESVLEEKAADELPGPDAANSEATAEGERETRLGLDESRFGTQDTLPFQEPPPSLASFLKDTQPEERARAAERSEPPGSPIIDEPAVEVRDQSAEDSEPGEVIEAFDVPREPNSPPGPEETASPALDDGIPVLHEIAEIEPGHEPPTPEQLRHIAIRVIARLNIERRKAGEAPLDIRTIKRLQQLLKEALSGGKPPRGD